jgi:hypothetical protein
MKQLTAIEWLISKILIPINQYDEDGLFDAEPKVIGIGYQNAFSSGTELVEFVNTAIKMEKKQIVEAFYQGADQESDTHGAQNLDMKDAENYYNETFKTK